MTPSPVRRGVEACQWIRDRAEAMRAYGRQANDRQMESDATELRARATRRLGELIDLQRKAGLLAKGTRGSGRPRLGGSQTDPPKDPAPTLSDVGINKHLADSARKLAAMPEEKFEERVAEWRKSTEGSTANLMRLLRTLLTISLIFSLACSTPQQRQNWKKAGETVLVLALIGGLVLAAVAADRECRRSGANCGGSPYQPPVSENRIHTVSGACSWHGGAVDAGTCIYGDLYCADGWDCVFR